MHKTRKLILNHLKVHGQATVDELAEVLHLTSVTVRHHLDILRSEELVSEPVIRHRATPGRPQYTFSLTEKASTHFPKNYETLAANVLAEIKAVSPKTVNVIFEGVAGRFAAEAPQPIPGEPMAVRLDRAVQFLNKHGYGARWEKTAEGYVLHTHNCPYAGLADDHPELCGMDTSLVSHLLGATMQCTGRLVEGAGSCAYLIYEIDAVAA